MQTYATFVTRLAALLATHRLVQLDLAVDAPAAHLVVQGVEQLLAGGGAGKRGPLE